MNTSFCNRSNIWSKNGEKSGDGGKTKPPPPISFLFTNPPEDHKNTIVYITIEYNRRPVLTFVIIEYNM